MIVSGKSVLFLIRTKLDFYSYSYVFSGMFFFVVIAKRKTHTRFAIGISVQSTFHFAWLSKWSEANTHINFRAKIGLLGTLALIRKTFQSHIFCYFFFLRVLYLHQQQMVCEPKYIRKIEIQVDSILFKQFCASINSFRSH